MLGIPIIRIYQDLYFPTLYLNMLQPNDVWFHHIIGRLAVEKSYELLCFDLKLSHKALMKNTF